MKIIVCSKPEFNRFMTYNGITDENVESKDMMIISINNSYDSDDFVHSVYSHFKRNHSNVLIMHFNDYSEEDVKNTKGATGVFNEFKAKKLYEFIKRNKDKKMAIIHCLGGISRSFTVGMFINDFFNDKHSKVDLKKTNPRGSLNYHIFGLLKEQYYKDH